MAGSIKIQQGATAGTPETNYSTLWVSITGQPYMQQSDGTSDRIVTTDVPQDTYTSIPGIKGIVTMTDLEYAALASKDKNTIYIVMDDAFGATYDWDSGALPDFNYVTSAYLGVVKIFSTAVNV